MTQREGRESHSKQPANRQQKYATEAAISAMATGPTAAQNRNRTYFFRLTRQLPPYLLTTRFLGGTLVGGHPTALVQFRCHYRTPNFHIKQRMWAVMAIMLPETAYVCTNMLGKCCANRARM